jgi:hypothetical protein
MADNSNNPMVIAAQNAQQRAALLATAPRMRKNLGTYTNIIGGNNRIKLFNVGVLTKLQLYVTAAVTIGVATATPSAKAPYNLIQRVRVTDYDGTDRVNFTGLQLFMLNCVRTRSTFGYHSGGNTAVFTNPAVPTAVGNGTVSFFIDVPLAYDVDNPVVQLQDLRGAIMAQTAVGEMYLSVDWITSLYANGDVESLYAGGATTTVVGNGANYISVTVWQEYLLPQAVAAGGVVPIPQVDLQTVYELSGNVRSSDNLSPNTDKIISYPNVRSVVGVYANYVQAGTMTQGKINGFKLVANGNNVVKDHSELSQLFTQRMFVTENADTLPGCYFWQHREKPIETSQFGAFQLYINPLTVGANPYVELGFESFYTKGMALPGIGQAQ